MANTIILQSGVCDIAMLNINSCIERCYKSELLTEDEVEELCDRLKGQRKSSPPLPHTRTPSSPIMCPFMCLPQCGTLEREGERERGIYRDIYIGREGERERVRQRRRRRERGMIISICTAELSSNNPRS